MANLVTSTEALDDTGVWSVDAVLTTNTHAAPAFAGVNAGMADTLNDDSATVTEGVVGLYYDIPANTNDYVGSVHIRKDAVTDRWPQLIMNMLSGPIGHVDLNTSTGEAAANTTGGTAPAAFGVVDVDANWWRLWMRIPNNGSGTSIRLTAYPSRVSALNGDFGSAFTGSAVYWGFNITQSSTVQAYEPEPFYTFVVRDAKLIIRAS
jgi:hypothetical protein